MGEPPLRLAPRHVEGKQVWVVPAFTARLMRSARTTALVCAVTRPGHDRHQSGELGRPLTLLQCPHRKTHQAVADGLLVFDPLSAFHVPAAREKFKGTQARTKNTLGWSVSAASVERRLTFLKFNSHSLSDSTKTVPTTLNSPVFDGTCWKSHTKSLPQ